MSISAYWWNALGLFLLLVWVIQRWRPGWRWLLVSALGAGAVSVIPFFGHPPRFWLSGLTPNISVPLLALLAASIVRRAGGPAFFRPREWRAAWIFGAAASWALYPSALGLGLRNFDAYALGWPWLEWLPSLLLFGGTALTAGCLVGRGNRFGWVLVAAAVAYLTGLQESRNFWDDLLDPLFGAASLVAVVVLGLRRS
jgi:uncharacterized membrane protein (GlpM family)